MIIRHAKVVTSKESFIGDILIRGNKIAQIGKDLSSEGDIIDADGLIAFPGGVDAHTHMDIDVGLAKSSDDFLTGSIAAACGGTTSIIDHMGFGPKNCPLGHQLRVYHQKANGKAVVDYGFHGVLQHVDDDVLSDMERLIGEGLTSYKAYLTYDGKLSDADVFRVLRRVRELNLILTVHPENDDIVNLLRKEFVENGLTAPKYHPLSRPDVLEAEAINRMLLFAHLAGDAPLYIVHLTNALGLRFIEDARNRGQKNIFAETCPQYLLFDDSVYDDPTHGLKYILSPPLRKKADNAALWEGLQRGAIDTVATDHCAFTMAQKLMGKDDFTRCPNGAPGVKLRMALMFSEGVVKRHFNLSAYARMTSANPARLFGLPDKGDIAVGKDADIVLFDPNIITTINSSILNENCDTSIYKGIDINGAPMMTISRGEIIVKDGVFVGDAGRGQYLRRGLPQL